MVLFECYLKVFIIPGACKLNNLAICEGSSFVIKCPDKSLIQIQSASYGRFNNETCPTNKTEDLHSCISKNVTDFVYNLYHGNNSCFVESNNNAFGNDTCLFTWKYTIVDYICYLENSIFIPKIENKYTETTLNKFYDEFVLSFVILSNGISTTSIIAITNGETSVMDLSINDGFSNIIFKEISTPITLTPNTWSSIIICQYFMSNNNTYNITVAVNGTVQYFNTSTQPMVFTDVVLYTFVACSTRPDCDFGSIKNLSIYSKTHVIWTQWADWSLCNASCYKSRSRNCSENGLLNCIGESIEVESCNNKYQGSWSHWNKWMRFNDSYSFIRRTRDCNNTTLCDQCYGINSEVIKLTALWLQWSNWLHFNDSYGFMNRTRSCIISKSQIFSMKDEILLSKGNLIKKIKRLSKEYSVSFEINPKSFQNNDYWNIIHFTTSNIYVSNGNPAVWVKPNSSGSLHICSNINGITDYCAQPIKFELLNWTSIKISQELINKTYIYSIKINNDTILNVENKDAREISNVNVFVSNPWYDAQPGYMRNLKILNKNIVLEHCSNISFNASNGVMNKTMECMMKCPGYKSEFAFWTPWSNWSICNDTHGFMNRSRVCNVSNAALLSNVCDGNNLDLLSCYAFWSQWSIWSSCNGTYGFMNRTRSCNVSHALNQCYGPNNDIMICFEKWTTWSECSATCGLGNRSRVSLPAVYSKVMVEGCTLINCPVNGMWGEWSNTNCSKTCGSEVITYNRSCNSPPPSFSGLNCMGVSFYTDSCNTDIICPINGNWSTWSSWSLCSQPCGGGVTSKFRSCSNPMPGFGGRNCDGSVVDFQNCPWQSCKNVDLNLAVTFIDEDYSQWFPIHSNKFPLKLKDDIKNAIAKLYSRQNINATFQLIIHSMENRP